MFSHSEVLRMMLRKVILEHQSKSKEIKRFLKAHPHDEECFPLSTCSWQCTRHQGLTKKIHKRLQIEHPRLK